MEKFLNEVLRLLLIDKSLVDLLKVESKTVFENLFYHSKSHRKDILKKSPKMTHINAVLHLKTVRERIYEKLQIKDLKFPGLSSSLLYGTISDQVHLPNFTMVYLSDNSEKEYKEFIYFLSSRYGLRIEEFSAAAAAAGAEKELKILKSKQTE